MQPQSILRHIVYWQTKKIMLYWFFVLQDISQILKIWNYWPPGAVAASKIYLVNYFTVLCKNNGTCACKYFHFNESENPTNSQYLCHCLFFLQVCNCIAVCSSNYDRDSSLLSINGSMSSPKRSNTISYIILFIISRIFRLVEMKSLTHASAIIFAKHCNK